MDNLKTVIKSTQVGSWLAELRVQSPKSWQELSYMRQGFPVLGNGIPKCGTHLLQSTLRRLPGLTCVGTTVTIAYFGSEFEDATGKRNAALDKLMNLRKGACRISHIIYDEEIVDRLKTRNCRTLLIIRDPRDVVCSHIDHAMRESDYRFHHYFSNVLKTQEDRVMASIRGISHEHSSTEHAGREENLTNINERYRRFIKWLNMPMNYTVKFEDLIGPKGGGDKAAQTRVIGEICDHLHIKAEKAKINAISDEVYNPQSRTFSRGTIGRWRNIFSYEHREEFKSIAGQLLIDLNYEQHFDW